jgi:hypothetical protein
MSYDPFLQTVGTKMRFGSTTQDMSNMTTGAALVYGSTSSFMVPDLYSTDYLPCVGANPKVSRWTLVSVPNDGMAVAKRIGQRGGKVLLRFSQRLSADHLCSNSTRTSAALVMSPIVDGLTITCCRARHRWDISAKPRSDQVRKALLSGLVQGLTQRGRLRGQHLDGLVLVPVRGGLGDPEAGPGGGCPAGPGTRPTRRPPASSRSGHGSRPGYRARAGALPAARTRTPRVGTERQDDTIGQHAEPALVEGDL